MKHKFQLPDFPDSTFEIERSPWTGKSKLLKDNIPVEQSKEKGKPFLIPNANGELIKAFPKLALPDFVLALEINGTKIHIFERLKWYQYLLGGLPFLLVFGGGAIGGLIGGLATLTNFKIFRQETSEVSKYLKVIGIVLASFTIYFFLAILISELIM